MAVRKLDQRLDHQVQLKRCKWMFAPLPFIFQSLLCWVY